MEAATIAPAQVLALSLTGGASQVCHASATSLEAGVAHGGHDPNCSFH